MATTNERFVAYIDAKSAGAIKELGKLQKEAKQTGDAFDRLGKRIGVSGESLRGGLVNGARALVGTGLVGFVLKSADAFVQAQDAAAQWARATNASVVEAGKFTMVARAIGLDMNDLIEINAEFSRKIREQPQLLEELNVQVAKNADGSVNMTKTLVSTIDALGSMKDGLKAAQIAAQLFGEEGSKQLAGFYLAGIKVADLQKRIKFVDQSKDALKYKAAVTELSLAWQQFQITLGAKVIPLLTSVADASTVAVEAFTTIPTPVYAAGAALTAMFFAASRFKQTSVFAEIASGLAEISMAKQGAKMDPLEFAEILDFDEYDVNREKEKIDKILEGRGRLATVTESLFAGIGPGALALGALAAGLVAVAFASRNFNDQVAEGSTRMAELEAAGTSTADAMQQTAEMIEANSNVFENFWAALKNTSGDKSARPWWEDWLVVIPVLGGYLADLIDAFRKGGQDSEEYADALSKIREEQGSAAAAAADAAVAQRSLNDMLTEGSYSQEELAAAAERAGTAQQRQNEQTATSEGLMAAYAASTYDAANATLSLFDKTFAANDAQRRYNDAIREFNEGGFENADDQAAALDDITQAALAAAGATAAQKQQQDLLNGVYNNSAYYTQIQIDKLKELAQQPGLPQAAIDNINGFITQLETAQTKGTDGVNVGVNVTGDAEAKGKVDSVAEDRTGTVTVETSFSPGGYEGVKARMDFLSQPKEGKVDISTAFLPGGYEAVKSRMDFLTQPKTSTININTAFGPGGYEAVKARKDYLTQDRTVTITQVVKTVSGGGGSGDGDGTTRSGSANMMFSPINMVRVSLDGRELRSVIDDEIRSLTPTRQEVA